MKSKKEKRRKQKEKKIVTICSTHQRMKLFAARPEAHVCESKETLCGKTMTCDNLQTNKIFKQSCVRFKI